MDLVKESDGLFIPKHILFDKDLTGNEKIILSQIYWYDHNSDCHASNKHLCKLLNIQIRGLQKIIKKLREKNYLTTNGKKIRILKINHVQMDAYDHVQMDTPPSKWTPSPCPNGHSDHVQMDTHIKKNSIKKIKKNIYCEDAQKILDYLNEKTGRHFKKAHGLMARFKEGYTVDDAMKVIDNKLMDTKFQELDGGRYMRPETLFCEKHFDSYLNEKPKKEETFAEKYCREKGITMEDLKNG